MRKTYKVVDGRLLESRSDEGQVLMFIRPDEEELRFLTAGLHVDPHTLNSALDPNELGRMEVETDYIALIIKRPKRYRVEDNFLFKISSVGIFVFSGKLVFVQAEDIELFEGRTLDKVRSLQELLLKVIYSTILHFEGHLQVINTMSDELESEISTAMENSHLLNLFTLEKSLVYYLNAINSNGKVIDKLKTSFAKFGFSPENMEFLEDVIIENNQCYEQAEIYSHVLSGLMDARASIVSNNLNVLMKALTLVMIAIMLPNLVLGIFSVNVKLPIAQDGTLASFWIVTSIAALSGVAVLFLWRHKKW